MFRNGKVLIRRVSCLFMPRRKKSIMERYDKNYCPPSCPKKKVIPKVTIAKTCEKCSFWMQEEDNCRGCPWELPINDKPLEAKCHACKSRKIGKCDKKTLENATASDIKVDQCPEVPDCPKPTWDCYK